MTDYSIPPYGGTERRCDAGASVICQSHSLALAVQEEKLQTLRDEITNYKTWRREMGEKLDDIHERITNGNEKLSSRMGGLLVRLGAMNAAALAMAWAYSQWGPK